MKEAIAILTGGGPAPGMNTVVGSVAKTFLRKGYRVIGLHEGYTGLFNPSPRTVDIDYPMADGIFNQGGSFLQMSRFKPKDSDFARAATGSYWLPWAAAPATWHSASARLATTR